MLAPNRLAASVADGLNCRPVSLSVACLLLLCRAVVLCASSGLQTWLAILRIAFLLPHVLPFLKRRRLSCPGFHKAFVAANAVLILVKVIVLLVAGVPMATSSTFFWWLLLILSAASILAQRACLHHLRSSMPTPRYHMTKYKSVIFATLGTDWLALKQMRFSASSSVVESA